MKRLTDIDGVDGPFDRAMSDPTRAFMSTVAKVRCPHPSCKGAARFQSKQGGVEWYQCRECGFSFSNDGGRKRSR